MFGGLWNFIRTRLIEPFLDADPADRMTIVLKYVLVMALFGAIMSLFSPATPIHHL